MKFLPIVAAVGLVAGALLIEGKAQAPAGEVTEGSVKYPYGKECVVTVDPQTWPAATAATPGKAGGFQPDWTVRGQLILLNDQWCVLKDGTFENWIPREKVLVLRASK